MSCESEETDDEVGDVVPHLRIGANLPQVSRECARITHDTQEVNPLQHHLTDTNTNPIQY